MHFDILRNGYVPCKGAGCGYCARDEAKKNEPTYSGLSLAAIAKKPPKVFQPEDAPVPELYEKHEPEEKVKQIAAKSLAEEREKMAAKPLPSKPESSGFFNSGIFAKDEDKNEKKEEEKGFFSTGIFAKKEDDKNEKKEEEKGFFSTGIFAKKEEENKEEEKGFFNSGIFAKKEEDKKEEKEEEKGFFNTGIFAKKEEDKNEEKEEDKGFFSTGIFAKKAAHSVKY